MTRNKYAALSFIPVTAARHDFGDLRRKRNLAFSAVFRRCPICICICVRGENATWPFHSYFVGCLAAPRLSSDEMTQPASSWHCRSGYKMIPITTPSGPQDHHHVYYHHYHFHPPLLRYLSSPWTGQDWFTGQYTSPALNHVQAATWKSFSYFPPARSLSSDFCAWSTFESLNILNILNFLSPWTSWT